MPSLRHKVFDFEGKSYNTRTFARDFGMPPGLVWQRVNHGIVDFRLPLDIDLNNFRRRNSKIRPRPKSAPRVPMYVMTYFGEWKV